MIKRKSKNGQYGLEYRKKYGMRKNTLLKIVNNILI